MKLYVNVTFLFIISLITVTLAWNPKDLTINASEITLSVSSFQHPNQDNHSLSILQVPKNFMAEGCKALWFDTKNDQMIYVLILYAKAKNKSLNIHYDMDQNIYYDSEIKSITHIYLKD